MTGEGVQGTTATNYTGLDQFGRVTASTQSTANSYQGTFTSYSFLYTYYTDGSLKTIQYPSLKIVQYDYDRMGRPTDAYTPYTVLVLGALFVDDATYGTTGMLASLKLGNNLYEQSCYNNRLQLTQKRLGTAVQSNCANPGNDLLHLTFGYGTATANNGNPVSQTIVASGYTLTQKVVALPDFP